MIEDEDLNEILGIDLSQEDKSISFQDTPVSDQQSRQKYVVNTVEAPKDYIQKLNKLLEAVDIVDTIVKSGKINYYTAESLFNIYPFISETDVKRTTKNMSTINYDSIRKTMLLNINTYIETLINELQEKWQSYQDNHYEIVNSDMIERTLNSFYAFSIENKDILKEFVTFSYVRKVKLLKNNTQEEEEVFFKFSELNEFNIKEYKNILEQDAYFNFIITNYNYYESNQLTFSNLLNQLSWIKAAINVCFKLNNAPDITYNPNPLIVVMTVFHKLSNLTNNDLDKLIKFIRDNAFRQYNELKIKHTIAQQELKSLTADIDNFTKITDVKNHFYEYLNVLTNETNCLKNIKFMHTYIVKNEQLLNDLKFTLNTFKKMFV